MKNASDVAKAESAKANHIDSPGSHREAANSHRRAAAEAFGEGDVGRAKKHQRAAKAHDKRAGELAKASSSSSASGAGGPPEVDQPDNDGKDECPLITWVSS